MKKIINIILGVFFALATLNFLTSSLIICLATSGTVQGSEFSMLITIANLFANFGIWAVSVVLFIVSKYVMNRGDVATSP